MIYLVYGADSYRAKEFIDSLKIPQKTTIDDPVKLDDVFDNFQQANLFETPELMIFRNLLGKVEYKHLTRLDRKQHEVVFWEEREKVDRRRKTVKTLLKGAEVREFPELKGHQVAKWIREETQDLGFPPASPAKRGGRGKIQDDAVKKLVELHGGNLWFIKNELDKLQAYVKSREEKVITAEDVKKLATGSLEEDIFEFTDAVGERKSDQALRLFQNLLNQHADEHYLLAMIVRQFRLLIQAKDGSLANQHPFVIKKSTQQAGNWEMEQLLDIYNQLTEIDHKVKTGRADLKTALTLLLARI